MLMCLSLGMKWLYGPRLEVFPSAMLDKSRTGFTSLLATLIAETDTAVDSGLSGFGKIESSCWK